MVFFRVQDSGCRRVLVGDLEVVLLPFVSEVLNSPHGCFSSP